MPTNQQPSPPPDSTPDIEDPFSPAACFARRKAIYDALRFETSLFSQEASRLSAARDALDDQIVEIEGQLTELENAEQAVYDSLDLEYQARIDVEEEQEKANS